MQALIATKRELYMQELDATDVRDLMITDNLKWQHVSQIFMNVGFSLACTQDAVVCKAKWNQLIPNYRWQISLYWQYFVILASIPKL